MSRPFEIMLRDELIQFTTVYVETFARSYFRFDPSHPGYGQSLLAYRKTIEENAESIYRAAAAGISSYLYDFDIIPNKSIDEFKFVYFLGRSIQLQLNARGLQHVAKVHMFTMIGLLDFRLRTLGYQKSQLRKAMTKLVRLDQFEAQLGATGCYLIYKCVSTAGKSAAPGTGHL